LGAASKTGGSVHPGGATTGWLILSPRPSWTGPEVPQFRAEETALTHAFTPRASS